MEIILLEKVRNLGGIGDKVSVKSGFARNYLVPYGKAVMATKANLEKFAKIRAELEVQALEALSAAKQFAEKLEGAVVNLTSKATEEGKLFGSITASNIVQALEGMGFDVKKSDISMPEGPIRTAGEHEVALLLHSDVTAKIKVVVAIEK